MVGIANSSGSVVVEYAYDAWGKLLETSGALADTVGQLNPIRYRSYYYDSETGYYFLSSRYYAPELCRFLSADAQLNDDDHIEGTNLFAYCYNNPVNMVDADGREAISISICLLIVLCSAVISYVIVENVSTSEFQTCWQGVCNDVSNMLSDVFEVLNTERIHAIIRQALPARGEPNSDQELYDKDGELKQRRHYGEDGRAEYDIDYKHGGTMDFPHKHLWDWSKTQPRNNQHIPVVK